MCNRPTGRITARGSKCGNSYVLESKKLLSSLIDKFAETEEIWHKRLGHCSMKILQKLWKENLITVKSTNKYSFCCNSCQMARAQKLPFVSSPSTTLRMFE